MSDLWAQQQIPILSVGTYAILFPNTLIGACMLQSLTEQWHYVAMALIIAYKQSALLFEMPRAEIGGTTNACHRMFNRRNVLIRCKSTKSRCCSSICGPRAASTKSDIFAGGGQANHNARMSPCAAWAVSDCAAWPIEL